MTATVVMSLSERLAAMADPIRLQIITLLAHRDHCVCHLVDALGLKQSLVSHHVGVLRRAGLVTSYPHPGDRRWLYYRLDWAAIQDLTASIGQLVDASAYNPTPLPCPIDLVRDEQA